MLHVKQITQIIDKGDVTSAHDALDQLLALGPKNVEALKLRAQLHAFEGRFAEEAQVWEKIATIDREDEDAITYFLKRQQEDREHFYFTDDIPGGGRRFLAYPRRLVSASFIGLLGCVAFLLASRLGTRFPVLAEPSVMIVLFALCVVLPWLAIVTTYFSTIRWVAVSPKGVTIATRVRRLHLNWADIAHVWLARSGDPDRPVLSLVFVPRDQKDRAFEIDLSGGTSSIRARTYLIREVSRAFASPVPVVRDQVSLGGASLVSY